MLVYIKNILRNHIIATHMYIRTDASIHRYNTYTYEPTPVYNVSTHTLIKLICTYNESSSLTVK